MGAVATVLLYNHYLGPDSQTVYSHEHYCGECRRHLKSPYAFPKYPEQLEARNESPFGLSLDENGPDRQLEHFAFCPWCGVEFAEGWWRDRIIQNERVVDHYRNPGTHKGDQHEFRGDGPECMANHWLATTDSRICWCDPEVEPGLMGCVIRHRDVKYEDVMAAWGEGDEDR